MRNRTTISTFGEETRLCHIRGQVGDTYWVNFKGFDRVLCVPLGVVSSQIS